MDIEDLEHNTRDGLHMASLAGTWIALVAGLAGMRQWEKSLRFAPRLPEGITRLAFNLALSRAAPAREDVLALDDLRAARRRRAELRHGEDELHAEGGELGRFASPLAALDPGPAPTPARGRAPAHRRWRTRNDERRRRDRRPPQSPRASTSAPTRRGSLTWTACSPRPPWCTPPPGSRPSTRFSPEESARTGTTYAPFDPESDYEKYVDGEPRADGVRNFLAGARHHACPRASDERPADARPPSAGSGNRKNELVLEVMKKQGVQVYDGVARTDQVLSRAHGVKVAVVSASENTVAALDGGGHQSISLTRAWTATP